MLVGVPKEIKDNEYRVGIVPSTVRELAEKGHTVMIETQAGAGAGFEDADYRSAGGEILLTGDDVFGRAEFIMKVKEPLASERKKLSRGQVLFTYLHLAPDRAQTEDLMATGVTAIAYETVTSQQGTLPLLMPMSEIAGRMAPQVGAHYLEKENGGRGVLLAVHRASPLRLSSSSAVVSQGRTRLRSLPAWEPMLPCLIAIRRRYAGSPLSWETVCERCFQPATWSSCYAVALTSLSVRSSCRARPRRS
jgi:alanine dehydrogenase